MDSVTQQSQRPALVTQTAGTFLRLLVPAVLGGAFAGVLCLAISATAKVAAVVIGGVVCLALLPIVAYFNNAIEDLSLFALALTLSVSLKFHPIFRLDHFGGAIGIRISVTELLMVVLVAAILLRNRKGSVRLQADTAILGAFFVYWVLAALSTLGGFDTALGVFQLVAAVQSVAVFIFLVSYLTNRRRLLIYLAGFLVALVCQSTITIAQSRKPDLDVLHYLGAPEQEDIEAVDGDVALPNVDLGTTFVQGDVQKRPAGLLIHPNVLAFYLVLAIPTAAGVFLISKQRWLMLLAFVSFVSAGIALYVSLSRSGWAGLVFAGMVAVVLGFWSVRSLAPQKKLIMALVMIIAVGGLVAKADRIYSRIFDTANEAIEFRENLANIALNMMRAHPMLGIGLNSFMEATDAYDPSGSQRLKKFPVHNVYLLEASEVGIPGGVAFLVMVVTIIVQTLRTAARTPQQWHWFCLLVAAGIGGFWFTQISDFAYRVPILTTILWSQVALVFAAAQISRTEAAL